MSHETKGRRLGRALGWLSIGLGMSQVRSPEAMNRFVGVVPTPDANTAMRAVGVQELTVGVAILATRKPTGWLWTRVVGDVVHLLVLRAALQSKNSDQGRIRGSLRGVAAICLADLIAAIRLSRTPPEAIRAETTITVSRPADEVYRLWRDLEQLPRFMEHLESVEEIKAGRWRWVARAPAGKKVKWHAEIVEDRPGHLIAWRSVGRGDVTNAGWVRFAPAPGDRGTEITVEVHYVPPGGRAGAAVAKLLGENPQQQVRDDVRRFKQVIETGEVVRSEGSPEGFSTRRQRKQHRGQPGS